MALPNTTNAIPLVIVDSYSSASSDSDSATSQVPMEIDETLSTLTAPVFRILTISRERLSLPEPSLRSLSPLIDEKFVSGEYQSTVMHDLPWLTMSVGNRVLSYIKTRTLDLPFDAEDPLDETMDFLKFSKYLGLTRLIELTLEAIVRDQKSGRMQLVDNTLQAACLVSRYVTTETAGYLKELVDLCVAGFTAEDARMFAGKVDDLKDSEIRESRTKAVIWEVMARALAKGVQEDVIKE